MPVITGEVLLGRSPVYSIPIFFLKKKIKLGIEGDLTSYLYDVLPLGPPFKKEKKVVWARRTIIKRMLTGS